MDRISPGSVEAYVLALVKDLASLDPVLCSVRLSDPFTRETCRFCGASVENELRDELAGHPKKSIQHNTSCVWRRAYALDLDRVWRLDAITRKHYITPEALDNARLDRVTSTLSGTAGADFEGLSATLSGWSPEQLAALLASVEKRRKPV